MTSDEAKLLLQAASLGAPEPDDPGLIEALEQARRDPDLFAWFQNQQAVDTAVAQRLQQIPVPADLADRIVAGLRTRRRAKRRRHALSLALAANLVALLTIAALLSGVFQSPTTEFTELQNDMAELLMTFPALELATDQWTRDGNAFLALTRGDQGFLRDLLKERPG
jgi:hypothetical protein